MPSQRLHGMHPLTRRRTSPLNPHLHRFLRWMEAKSIAQANLWRSKVMLLDLGPLKGGLARALRRLESSKKKESMRLLL